MTDKEILEALIAEIKRIIDVIIEDTELLEFITDCMQEKSNSVVENMVDAAESLGISQEEYDKIVDECIYGKEPEMVDADDLLLDACNIQYASIEGAIKAHAEDYSFNIESELFQQLTPEQQRMWRKEIEQAVISGGYSGLNLAKDRRYDDTPEMKEVNSNDAFIKKACIWFEHNLHMYNTSECLGDREEFVEDFKKAMKGESA